ncbi:MAG: YceD family protein [Gammaproteobacteria bacterium]
MQNDLPVICCPYQLANKQQRFVGQLPLAAMSRLATLIENTEGLVDVELDFKFDEDNRCVITGNISGQVRVICQRCLIPMTVLITAQFSLTPVVDEQETLHTVRDYEPILLKEGKISIATLVEDELLLNMPYLPAHDTAECHSIQQQHLSDTRVGHNAFKVLAALK